MTPPTLLVFGNADAVQLSHAIEFFALFGGGLRDGGVDKSGMSRSQLASLPGTTHYEMLRSPLLPSVVTRFLDSD